MKKIKIIALIAIGLISLFSYGITTESIINNYVETKSTLSLDEFEYVAPSIPTSDSDTQKAKLIYKSKATGRLWMIDPNFDATTAKHYVFGGLYSLVLGERSPELRLITNQNGQLMMGSEFIPEFTSVMDFFLPDLRSILNHIRQSGSDNIPGYKNLKDFQNAQTKNFAKLKRCFPSGCESLSITGAEEILVLMILLGDLDGNTTNLGLVPSKEKDGFFEVAKIDHDEAGTGFVQNITLRSMAKIVFGEGKSYFTEFDYEKFDLNKMADIFDLIADLPDEIWGQTILMRAQDIRLSGHTEDDWGTSMWPQFAESLNQRKAQCRAFVLGLRCEAAVRSNDFKAIQNLIELGFDPNTPVDYIHIDSVQEKQIASLVKLGHAISHGQTEAEPYYIKYAQQNGPIPILELAVRYKQLSLVKQLTPLSNAQSRKKALNAAIEIGAKKTADFLKNYKPQPKHNDL